MSWISTINFNDLEVEGIARFDHGGRTYAIYRTSGDEVYCTDGLCSHEAVHLCDGLLDGHEIECPKHSGLFDIRTGEAKALPACVNLRTYPARVMEGLVEIDI